MAQPWMDIAWKQQGQAEIPGAAANPEIIKYFADAGHPEVHSDEVSWCAAFACACLERAGIRSPRTLLARDFLHFGTPIDQPRMGAIAVFSRPPDPHHGHVGFVAGETENAIVLLGGNQANKVGVIHMPKARLIGLRWPADGMTSAGLKAAGSRTIKAADDGIVAQGVASASAIAAVGGAQLDTHVQTLSKVADKASELKNTATTFMEIGQFLQHSWIWIAGIIAAYFGCKAIWHAYQVKQYRTQDANTGAHQGTGATDADPGEALIR
jgi:uncharacterized protein (TIGR02594 family)